MLDRKRKTNRPRKDRKPAQSHTAVRCRSQAPGSQPQSRLPVSLPAALSFHQVFPGPVLVYISHRLRYSGPQRSLAASLSLQRRLSFVTSCASDSLKLHTGQILSLHGIKSTRQTQSKINKHPVSSFVPMHPMSLPMHPQNQTCFAGSSDPGLKLARRLAVSTPTFTKF